MAGSIDRSAFLRRAGTAAAALMGAPLIISSRATAASDRLVVAVGQWGTETPFAWRHVQAEKPLWDCVYDPLITRDPKTFVYRPGAGSGVEAVERNADVDVQARAGVRQSTVRLRAAAIALTHTPSGWTQPSGHGCCA